MVVQISDRYLPSYYLQIFFSLGEELVNLGWLGIMVCIDIFSDPPSYVALKVQVRAVLGGLEKLAVEAEDCPFLTHLIKYN